MDTETKPTRVRKTDAERLKELDAQIDKAERRLDRLHRDRAALVEKITAQRDELDAALKA